MSEAHNSLHAKSRQHCSRMYTCGLSSGPVLTRSFPKINALFVALYSFLSLGQCAIEIPDGVFAAQACAEASDQDASYSFAAHTPLISFGDYERNTCNSIFATFSLQDSHSLCF